ncbi:hypothetical protein VTI28DRAFT_7651 [Corynascus sepedonium]
MEYKNYSFHSVCFWIAIPRFKLLEELVAYKRGQHLRPYECVTYQNTLCRGLIRSFAKIGSKRILNPSSSKKACVVLAQTTTPPNKSGWPVITSVIITLLATLLATNHILLLRCQMFSRPLISPVFVLFGHLTNVTLSTFLLTMLG